MKNIVLITVLMLGITLMSFSQDAHLSQFDMSPVWLNPAQTGMDKDMGFRASNQSRSQWGSITGKYVTSLLSYEMPMNARWGFGGYLIDDDAAKTYNVFKFVASGSYQITTDNDKHYLSTGLQIGMIYKNLNENRLLFNNQWYEGVFDSDLPTGEALDKYHVILPEVNLGIYYKFKNGVKKYKPYGGFTIFHATSPRENFTSGDKSYLPMRFQLNAGSKFFIDDQWTVEPIALYMRQRNVQEIYGGAKGYYSINDDIQILAGGYYRLQDAVTMLVGIQYKNLIFQSSYDLNISDLKTYTNGKGAFEFSIIFLSKKTFFSALM